MHDLSHPLPGTQPCPYWALVVAQDFGALPKDDLWRLCVWLVATGCTFVGFDGAHSDRAEDFYDETVVYAELAIEGDAELRAWISELSDTPIEASGAARWGIGYMSSTSRPFASLPAFAAYGFFADEPPELAIAIPLDAVSATVVQDVFHPRPPLNPAPASILHALAPDGFLTASINLGNPVLAQGTPAAPTGVTVDIARELGARLGVPVGLLCVDAAQASLEALLTGEADICFVASEPGCDENVVFTAPFVLPAEALGTLRTRPSPTIRFLRSFIEELKSNGFVTDALRRSKQGATVAPPAR